MNCSRCGEEMRSCGHRVYTDRKRITWEETRYAYVSENKKRTGVNGVDLQKRRGNGRDVMFSKGEKIKNRKGEREYTVVGVRRDGTLDVESIGTGKRSHLRRPEEYRKVRGDAGRE